MTRDEVAEVAEVLNMLSQAQAVAHEAVLAFNNLKNHPGSRHEGLAELLRAQAQNAAALVSQATKIWLMVKLNGSNPGG